MGNEASLEGGEGLEGAAAAGDGGGPAAPSQPLVPAGVEADLSQLSEEERRQIAAVMSRAQGLPRGNLAGAEPPPMQRHARKIALLPLFPSPLLRLLAVGRGAIRARSIGPAFSGGGREAAREGRGRLHERSDGVRTPPLFPLRWFLIISASLRSGLSPPIAPFCVWVGGDVPAAFGFSVCMRASGGRGAQQLREQPGELS